MPEKEMICAISQRDGVVIEVEGDWINIIQTSRPEEADIVIVLIQDIPDLVNALEKIR